MYKKTVTGISGYGSAMFFPFLLFNESHILNFIAI